MCECTVLFEFTKAIFFKIFLELGVAQNAGFSITIEFLANLVFMLFMTHLSEFAITRLIEFADIDIHFTS